MRGAGTPQALAMIETAMDHLASELKISPLLLRQKNFLKPGDVTPFHQKIEDKHYDLDKVWKQLLASSNYDERQKKVNEFNAANKYKKRGLSIVPTKYNMVPPIFGFILKASVCVSLHADGSCLMSHGAIEMGQGVHTKLQQICAHTLGLPMESISTPNVNSQISPNAPGTGGSMTTDVYGPCVIDACNQLLARLEPFKQEGVSVQQAIGAAAKAGLLLNAFGSFQFPNWGYSSPFSHEFLYFSWNAAVCEAEIDVLTGEYKMLQADLIQDIGRSLNPALDVGQVEGGFVQGMSWLLLEDVEACYDKAGQCSLSSETLEIAGIKNMPITFNVALFQGNNSANPKAPYGSKGIGEPPYSLGIAGPLAIRAAMAAAREQNGLPGWQTNIAYPLTVARVAMNLGFDPKKA